MSEEAYNMQDDDIEMADSEDDIEEDEDDEEEEEMNEAPAAPPEPAEEDAVVARRRAIQAIMRDTTLSESDKRMQIQNLMSGGRTEVAPPPAPVLPAPEANAACVHYERNCNVVAPCCNRVFGCRICHDELSPTGHPPMNRFMVQEVVCKNCNTRQATSYVHFTRMPIPAFSILIAHAIPSICIHTGTSASTAKRSLESIIAVSVTFGCRW